MALGLARAAPFLLGAALGASIADAATIQILSTNRRAVATAYLTNDVIEQTDADSLVAAGTLPVEGSVAAALTLGANSCASEAAHSSTFAPSAFHGTGSQSSSAEDFETFGFCVAGGSSRFEVSFRLTESSDYTLQGFIEAGDLGQSNVLLSGPGGTIYSTFAGFAHVPFLKTGTLAPADYFLSIVTGGDSHGWPPFPSYSSGAYEVHFALASATDAPILEPGDALRVSPNPFTAATRIALPDGAKSVDVFDPAGRLVRTLAGAESIVWDGRDAKGASVPAGVYFVRASGSPPAGSVKILRVR